jgi:hypothetical protein
MTTKTIVHTMLPNINSLKSISSGWCKFGRVYLHIHVHIDLAKLYTSQFFSGTCKLGRVYSNGYIFKRLYFQRLYFQTAIFPTAIFPTAIFPTAIFLIYINHPYYFSSSTLLAVTSLLTQISLSSFTQHNEHIHLGHEFFVIFIWRR